MTILTYTLKLVSDAMPSSGFGTELIDSLVTRNTEGQPIIRASHIKGVMRQTIQDTVSLMGYVQLPLIKNVFGSSPDEDIDCGAVFSLSNAVLKDGGDSIVVTRTRINEHGVADIGSLRSSELVAVGSVFIGKCYLDVEHGSVEDIAVRFSLLALEAIGGSRTRGVGQCIVTIDGENRTPGVLLKELDTLLKNGVQPRVFDTGHRTRDFKNEDVQLFRIDFQAESPVCCPETPVKTNLMSSGFSIPASAVQGAILHKLNREYPDVASACFESDKFRVWPLQPIPDGASDSVRVSLTHKVDKNARAIKEESKSSWFDDEAIHENWREKAPGAPLKSTDGVLITTEDGMVLWKSSAMPRVVSIHNSVHTDNNGLFSLESMAPGRWTGFVTLPAEAAEILQTLVKENPYFVFGKRRSVQGGGKLILKKIDGIPIPEHIKSKDTILITQSPIQIDYKPDQSLEKVFLELATSWAKEHSLPAPVRVWADAGIRFGWNRHRLGKTIGEQSRLQALPVIQPGAVIKFSGKVDTLALEKAIIAGLGKGKQRGFGSLLYHPGVACKMHKEKRKLKDVSSSAKKAMEKAISIQKGNESLPSSSQISALLNCLKKEGREAAKEYLEQQKNTRGVKYWTDWQETYRDFLTLLYIEDADKALRYLANIAIARRKDEA